MESHQIKKVDSSSCSYLRDCNGILTDDAHAKSKILNDQFSSAYSPPTVTDVVFVDPPCDTPSPDIVVTVNGVLKLLNELQAHKATGPDGIPPRILKELATEFAPVLTVIFNASLKQGIVPEDWRTAHVAPIFKKGDPLTPSNYRPVSLTSIPCKVMEHIVHHNIINHMSSNGILCDNQHGFRKLRS